LHYTLVRNPFYGAAWPVMYIAIVLSILATPGSRPIDRATSRLGSPGIKIWTRDRRGLFQGIRLRQPMRPCGSHCEYVPQLRFESCRRWNLRKAQDGNPENIATQYK
jgi:hypothetical protein